MKLKSLLFALAIFPLLLSAQDDAKTKSPIMSAGEKRAKIAFEGGYYLANDYNKIVPGENFSVDLSYMINGKVSFINHYDFGRNRYFAESNNPLLGLQEDSINADILTIHAGFMLGYTTPISKVFTITGAIGVASYSETIVYPVYLVDGFEIKTGYQQESRTIATIPMKFSLQYMVTDYFELGIATGFYFAPGQSLIGQYFGPQAIFKI